MSKYPTKPPIQPGQTNQRKIEIEPGVWVDYDAWQVQQRRDARDWEIYQVSDEDRALNIKRLQQVILEGFGKKREPVVVEKKIAKPIFEPVVEDEPIWEPPNDWEFDDEPF